MVLRLEVLQIAEYYNSGKQVLKIVKFKIKIFFLTAFIQQKIQ